MSHEIDTTTGRAAMAYTGDEPWHHLGHRLDPDATIEEWREAAGLQWEALRSPVQFDGKNDDLTVFKGRDVLFRSDTGAPLSTVSSDYQIAQPAQVMDFFNALSTQGGFQMETAGALFEGRRIWALARVGVDVAVLDDVIAPYLMMATSYDGSMSTFAQFTTVRVVCNNTLQASLSNTKKQNRIAIPHSSMFNPQSVADKLMLSEETWTGFADVARALAKYKMTDVEMDTYLQAVLAGPQDDPDKIRTSKGYRRILGLFQGGQRGAGQDAVKATAWGALNATTEYIDHEVGVKQDNRLDSAWFGKGAQLKQRAASVLTEMANA